METIQERLKLSEIKHKNYTLAENPNEFRNKYMFVNDINKIRSLELMEYNIWYEGESMILQNFYRVNNMIDYNYEPIFLENKRSFFWSVSSTEDDFKRTHSGMPREIIDVMTNIIGNSKPSMSNSCTVGGEEDPIEEIKKANKWSNMEKQLIIPMVLVEGDGAVKIDWDTDVSDEPIFQYYRAADFTCRYVYKTILTGMTFIDYYIREGNTYALFEDRDIVGNDVHFIKTLYQIDINNQLTKIDYIQAKRLFPNMNLDSITITNFKYLLAEHFIFFRDTSGAGEGRGRSVFRAKIDLFDDLDQALSLASISVRRSSPKVFIDTELLPRDENGFPIAPNDFDTKYIKYKGARDSSGGLSSSDPATVVQPNINFEQYQTQAGDIVLHILQGLLSPATLGIDISKRDNADAQREKEKITIFTREAIIKNYGRQVEELFKQALCIRQYIKEGLEGVENPGISDLDYDVHCDFETFADASFENKLTVLGNALTTNCISPELYVEELWGKNLTKEQKDKELEFIKKMKEQGMGGVGMNAFNQQEQDTFGDPDEPDYSDSKEQSESDMTNTSYNRNNEQGK